MSITLNQAQAATLAGVVAETDAPVQLHQVGESPDVLVTTGGKREPDRLLRADCVREPIREHAERPA